jgi:Trk-type K+ transport system membrane component
MGERMDVNVKGWLSLLGVLAFFIFEVFLIAWMPEAIAGKMLDEIKKHPELTALLNDPEFITLQNATTSALIVALIVAIVGLLVWGIYETTIDITRDSFIPPR